MPGSCLSLCLPSLSVVFDVQPTQGRQCSFLQRSLCSAGRWAEATDKRAWPDLWPCQQHKEEAVVTGDWPLEQWPSQKALRLHAKPGGHLEEP